MLEPFRVICTMQHRGCFPWEVEWGPSKHLERWRRRGQRKGLMQMSQQAPPPQPTSSAMEDYMSILSAGGGDGSGGGMPPPPPPPLPMTRLMTGPPDVMGRGMGLDDSQSMVIDAFDPMQFTPYGGADTVR
jgi:hypothetical protein